MVLIKKSEKNWLNTVQHTPHRVTFPGCVRVFDGRAQTAQLQPPSHQGWHDWTRSRGWVVSFLRNPNPEARPNVVASCLCVRLGLKLQSGTRPAGWRILANVLRHQLIWCAPLKCSHIWFCPMCQQKTSSQKQLILDNLPNCFFIHLKRFEKEVEKGAYRINRIFEVSFEHHFGQLGVTMQQESDTL